MTFLNVDEIIKIHGKLILKTGGIDGSYEYDEILDWISGHKV